MTQLPPWHIVENMIQKEKTWVTNTFDFGPFSSKEDSHSGISLDGMLRQICISIVSGKISACEVKSNKVNGLWAENTEGWELGANEERHGGAWHRAMMSLVKKHFVECQFQVVNEPALSWGRADLCAYKEDYPDLYVEIGTTSLFKTWFNSQTMLNVIFLFVPTVYNAIEFKINAHT